MTLASQSNESLGDIGMRYAIWNNKGGVGKTFLSFILSTEYALKNPGKKVLVVDMCPQANLSEIFLGGNSKGSDCLSEYIKEKKTIGAYINERIKAPHTKTGNETAYFTQVSEKNSNIPNNLYLVVGDPQLEIQAQVMNQISSQTLPRETWKNVHSWVLDLIIANESKYAGPNENSIITFIDCNPSFSAYTEMSLLASLNLIVPCSSDGSSARAIDNLASLVYGHNLPDELKGASFYKRAKEDFGMPLPVIHSILLNRSTQYRKKASRAFGAMFEEIKKRSEQFKEKRSEVFSASFDYQDIPDAHTPAVVCSDLGKPISQLRAGPYIIQDETVQVNQVPLNRYKEAIERLVKTLV